MSTISLCMIVKDEEKHLKDCLDSVKGLVDEIIIVDTGSTDDTKNIAKRSNAKVFDFKWCDDFSKARNESLRHATKEWILVLDADEIIDKDDHDKIKRLIDTDEVAFAFDQWSYIDQKEPKAKKNTNRFSHPFYISHRPVRLFRNNLGIRFMNRVHELVEHSLKEHNLKEVKTNIIIHHFGSLKGSDFINQKAEKYAELILRQLKENPNNPRYNYQAANMYLGKGDKQKALDHFMATARVDPAYKLVHQEIAKLFLSVGKIEKAIEHLNFAMHNSPDNPSPANNLAVLYMRQKRYILAKALLEKYLKKDPKNKALLTNYTILKKLLST
ncbi:hypothetical protein COV93_07455 [Candidatus Woesearchaeota archaeon CG11_big_fil_rev_8_21_14_0_20_43_8]|nr:MAG: hypothetical protein COV93_07455 [Candidatus Woesearchaeota archaeon CG11_big_fil_rev_8_21_14_0_20_43_8]